MNSKIVIAATFVLSTAVANVLQKKTMATVGSTESVSWAIVKRLLANPYLWCGMLSYAVALTMYLALLARVPLNVATSIAALNFIAVQLAARFVFGEHVPPLPYLGFACIVAGIWIVSVTQRPAA